MNRAQRWILAIGVPGSFLSFPIILLTCSALSISIGSDAGQLFGIWFWMVLIGLAITFFEFWIFKNGGSHD